MQLSVDMVDFGLVLLLVSIFGQYIWEQWYCELSPERRERRKQRAVEREFYRGVPRRKGRELNTRGRYLCVLPISAAFHLVFRSLSFGRSTVIAVLVAPSLVSRPLSTVWTLYYRYFGRRHTTTPPLPVELWEKIIGYTLDISEYFTTSCEVDTLPEFLAYHRIQSFPLPSWDPYRQSLRSRCQLRLVSRTWARIVRDCATPTWHSGPFNIDALSRQSLTGYHRVDLYDRYNASRVADPSGTKQSHLTKLQSSPLSILAIKKVYHSDNEQNQMLDLFKGSLEPWASVKSFAYCCSFSSNTFISQLATTFTSLNTLILDGTSICAYVEVTFPHVHTLDLAFEVCDYANWSLPQLRHLIVTNQLSFGGYCANERLDQIVPAHFNNLEALVLNQETVVIDSALWSRFPKLRLLGCADLVLSNGPPLDHPICHLYLSGGNTYSLTPDRFDRLLRLFGGNKQVKKTLFITPPYVRQCPYWDQWARFYAESQHKGVEWRPISPSVDFDGSWPLLAPETTVGIVENLLVDWALELYVATTIAFFFGFFRPYPIYLRPIPLTLAYFIYSVLRDATQ